PVLDRLDPADPRADDDAAALGVFLGEVDAGVGDGLDGRGEAELGDAVEAAGLAVLDLGGGIPPLDLAGDGDVPLAGVAVELGAFDGPDPAPAFPHGRPC